MSLSMCRAVWQIGLMNIYERRDHDGWGADAAEDVWLRGGFKV